jgi:hypothetical protein
MLPSGGQAMHRHAPLSSGGGVARNFPSSYLLMLRSHHLRRGALPMRVVVYDEAGDVAFVMDAPALSPEARNFRQHVFEGDQGE